MLQWDCIEPHLSLPSSPSPPFPSPAIRLVTDLSDNSPYNFSTLKIFIQLSKSHIYHHTHYVEAPPPHDHLSHCPGWPMSCSPLQESQAGAPPPSREGLPVPAHRSSIRPQGSAAPAESRDQRSSSARSCSIAVTRCLPLAQRTLLLPEPPKTVQLKHYF